MSGSAPTPLLPPATPPPAAPVAPSGGTPGTGTPGGPGMHPSSTTGGTSQGLGGGSLSSSHADAAPAPIPVSSARAQKDAIADATNRHAGGDVMRAARRIGAALNAPDLLNKADFQFFWITAVTTDSQIVVANSYGMGYIPEAVTLPEGVQLVSADSAIPAAERARWATYPMLAIQGWAAAHDITLRAVIATEAQFREFDPGVYREVLREEDIPPSGKMRGRSRLEVVAPEQATQLAEVSDLRLIDMLPPAPVDANPPTDQRGTLWFEVYKHLMNSDPGRGVEHLQAFVTYAGHAQELALYRAHVAVHAVEQRTAVADWLYWQQLSDLMADALAGSIAP